MPTSLMSVTLVGETVGSALLAWPLLGEAIPPLTAIGGAAILLGIYLTARGA